MKRLLAAGLLAFALLFAVSYTVGNGAGQTRSVMAQDSTPVATTVAQPAQTTTQPVQQRDDNNGFPWGLLGLLGLAGLAGLRRQPEPIRHEATNATPKVGVYDNTKR